MMHENYHSPTSINAGKRKGRKEGGGGGRGEQMGGDGMGGRVAAGREELCERHGAPSLHDKKGHCL